MSTPTPLPFAAQFQPGLPREVGNHALQLLVGLGILLLELRLLLGEADAV
jgi:hypothetical protein